MRIEIEIPKEFEEHFKQDKFKDSLERIMADLKNSLCTGRYEYETIEMFEKAFENSKPTTYDIDKVVKELEKREEHYVEMLDWQGQSAICDAIEIVKQGGVSDDVCEWKRDDMLYTVYKICGGCFTSVYQKDFKFCPYCGKKIKVVE